jgi:hypothetical protein
VRVGRGVGVRVGRGVGVGWGVGVGVGVALAWVEESVWVEELESARIEETAWVEGLELARVSPAYEYQLEYVKAGAQECLWE